MMRQMTGDQIIVIEEIEDDWTRNCIGLDNYPTVLMVEWERGSWFLLGKIYEHVGAVMHRPEGILMVEINMAKVENMVLMP